MRCRYVTNLKTFGLCALTILGFAIQSRADECPEPPAPTQYSFSVSYQTNEVAYHDEVLDAVVNTIKIKMKNIANMADINDIKISVYPAQGKIYIDIINVWFNKRYLPGDKPYMEAKLILEEMKASSLIQDFSDNPAIERKMLIDWREQCPKH